METNTEFQQYVKEYTDRVVKAFDNKIKYVGFCQTIKDYTEHHIYEFKILEKFKLSKEQIEILTEDDDSQPNNSYNIYLDTIYIYSTRYQ